MPIILLNMPSSTTPQLLEMLVARDLESMQGCPDAPSCADCPQDVCVRVVAVADFPSELGHFRIVGFVNNRDGKDHVIILKGDVGDGQGVLTRIHSACLTGDALGSLRCDCGPQLREALRLIEAAGSGLVLYHQAEGRGIGLANKLRAYTLQDRGLDTYEANLALGFGADERDYRIPALMLQRIGITSVRLMTNNLEKVEAMRRYGVDVVERVPHELPAHANVRRYLETKKERFGHLLRLEHGAKR